MSFLFSDSNYTELTDAKDTSVILIKDTGAVDKLLVDVVSDKGGDLDIIRYLGPNQSRPGEAPAQQTIAPGGGVITIDIPELGAISVLLTFTKTEAGTTSGFTMKQDCKG